MPFAVVYDRATHIARGPAPGAVTLQRAILARFPMLRSLGIYNPRNVRGGARLSLHAEGRAIDIGVSPRQRGIGDALAEALTLDTRTLGVQYIIWNRRQWTAIRAREGWRTYSGVSPHTDHLHIELTKAAGAHLSSAVANRTLQKADNPMVTTHELPINRKATIQAMQRRLHDAGYYTGEIDGDPYTLTLAAVVAALVHAKLGREFEADPEDAALADAARKFLGAAGVTLPTD